MKLKKFTDKIYQKIQANNSKETPLDISTYDIKSILSWRLSKRESTKYNFWFKNVCKCKNEILKICSRSSKILEYFTLCVKCKKEFTNIKLYGENYGSDKYEHTKLTNQKKYGCDNVFQANEVKNKIIQSNQEKFGVDYPMQSEKIREKSKQTCLEKYGTDYANQSEIVKDKIRETNLERYGVEHPLQNEEIREKSKRTCLRNYGVENPLQNKDVLEKVQNTLEYHFGKRFALQLDEFKDKQKQTMIDKYGVENAFQSDELREKGIQTNLERYDVENPGILDSSYEYQGIGFDSSWELAFYIYHKDKGHKITRNTKSFTYKDTNSKQLKYYYPDFKLNKRYYEIKGEQFIIRYKNGNVKTLINPYTKELCSSKYNCMKRNKVILITKNEIGKYLDYINNTYNKDYLKQFKIIQEK